MNSRCSSCKGGVLFVYTDGVPEAAREKEELFGMQRTLEAVNSAKDDTPKALLEHVHDTINEFVGDASQFDDLTMLAIKLL